VWAAVLILVQGFSSWAAYAHIPTGDSLKVTTQVGDYTLKVMVYPGTPEANKTCEIIVGIINTNTYSTYRGSVRINDIPATEFSPGFYEVGYIFREKGNTSVTVELAHDGDPLTAAIAVEVREPSGLGMLFLGGLLTAVVLTLVFVGYVKYKK
jgi:hypothetical protein